MNLGQILTQRFDLSAEQWRACLDEHKRSQASLVRLLINKNLIPEQNLLQALSEHLNIPLVRITPEDIDTSLIKDIPAKFVTHYNFMPLKAVGASVRIAVNDPLDVLVLDEISQFLKRPVAAVLASEKDILDAIKNYYGVGAETLEAMAGEAAQPQELEFLTGSDNADLKDEDIDPSVIKFLNQIFQEAIKQRATDVHFEPFENDLRIRYRIDGILYEVPVPPTIKRFQSSIASRIKVMANLDIAEKRRPQDGRVDVRMEGEVYDLRISIMPTPFGESIGIRVLPRSSPVIGLEGLGLDHDGLVSLERMIAKPYGIILVTGPTGSGKTTTLYASLNKINSTERKILTIEDPIEYQLAGITQMQVEPKISFTFANALRSMLRHDPDVMMVGEIRDSETAELAVRTALTGHLVFSTLHTNDAAGGITRLLDMGIDPFLVSSSVILIIAQRLVRTICPQCRQKIPDSESLVRQFFPDKPLTAALYQGKGCESCRFTGYKGRTAIFEMVVISDEIRELILKKQPTHIIKQKAVSQGMRVLRDAGWEKIIRGVTTIDEVVRVTQEEA
jgi:type II secretion system protein E